MAWGKYFVYTLWNVLFCINGCREFYGQTTKEIDEETRNLGLGEDITDEVEVLIKYDGYIKRQMKQVEQFKKLEAKKIPEDLDYEKVGSLRIEARQKLEEYRPVSIGQASRISGVSPADISVLLVYLEQYRRNA